MRSITLLTLLIAAFFFYSCEDNVEQEVAQSQTPANRLKARAGSDKQVQINTPVELDGINSEDGNGKPFEFRWTMKQMPAGSKATLADAGTPHPSFVPDLAGKYLVELKISQGSFSATDEVSVFVTEKEVEGAPLLISENIYADMVLEDVYGEHDKPDYRVTDLIHVNAMLKIKPGVVIEFESDKGLQINAGSLIAVGTADNKIVFTGVEKVAGYWKGITFFSNDLSNELSHTVVEYGGSSITPGTLSQFRANIFLSGSDISGATLKITNSVISHAGEYGLYVNGLSYFTEFGQNNFHDNTGIAAYVPASLIHRIDGLTSFSNNNYDGVETGGALISTENVQWHALNNHLAYLVTSDIVVHTGLAMEEGVTLKFKKGRSFTVSHTGSLTAAGSETSPVTFTALVNYGGNNWKGMLIQSVSDFNQLSYVDVSYAGDVAFDEAGDLKTNIVVTGTAEVMNSQIHHGNGWGIVAENGVVNVEVETSNTFYNLVAGNVKRRIVSEPVELTGEWMDWWSITNNRNVVNTSLYDRVTGVWFGGAADPWSMTNAGFGLKINADGNYIWTIAEHSPMTGCVSYSAEYLKGQVQMGPNTLTFVEESWRSKFYFSCDESQNVDMDVQPGQMTLFVETAQETLSGKKYDVLKLTSGGSTFKYYRAR